MGSASHGVSRALAMEPLGQPRPLAGTCSPCWDAQGFALCEREPAAGDVPGPLLWIPQVPGAARCQSVCVHKSESAGSKGSNAVRMVLLSHDPGVNSNTLFLLKDTRKKICEQSSNLSTQDGALHPRVCEVWVG